MQQVVFSNDAAPQNASPRTPPEVVLVSSYATHTHTRRRAGEMKIAVNFHTPVIIRTCDAYLFRALSCRGTLERYTKRTYPTTTRSGVKRAYAATWITGRPLVLRAYAYGRA